MDAKKAAIFLFIANILLSFIIALVVYKVITNNEKPTTSNNIVNQDSVQVANDALSNNPNTAKIK
jgi:CHASE3 domain sensor protein